MDESENLQERREKAIAFLKKKYLWATYIVLAIITFIAVRVRMLNLAGLRDITTGGWTLGPDLDPFLFLRWAKTIVAQGSLPLWDWMRYLPIGFETRGELILLPYMMAWFHSFASIFGSTSVEQSAVLFPAFMFGLTVISFFLFTRLLLRDSVGELRSSIIALVACLFLSVIPVLLPRTIAGIPEKESVAFFFMFLSFYLFLLAWKSNGKYNHYIYSVLAAFSTAAMALVWGGYIYIMLTLALAVFIALIFYQINVKRFSDYAIFIIMSFFIMSQFSTRYTIVNILSSTATGTSVAVLGMAFVYLALEHAKKKREIKLPFDHVISPPIMAIIITAILGILAASLMFGITFIPNELTTTIRQLVRPVVDRLGLTVAENRQPYFNEWAGSFGPVILNIPLTFWLFFIGGILLFYHSVSKFKLREKIYLTIGYIIFLIAIVFSRYSTTGVFNGENLASLLLYFGGILIFLCITGYYYVSHYKTRNNESFREVPFETLLLLSFFVLTLITARSAVRLIMVLVAPASILIGYTIVELTAIAYNLPKTDKKKIYLMIVAGIVVLSALISAYGLYNATAATAQSYIPGAYNQQWQQAMAWVRENTSQDAVFAHWWDYGYWIQTIGERATVLDGANIYVYWNHMMGRYALTGSNEKEALEFLYAHNATHFLIDSSDIGKYTAFATIGSDPNYDRRSWIVSFQKDNSQTAEKKNSTAFLYRGGTALDEDIVYSLNGSKIFLPGLNNRQDYDAGNIAAVIGVIIEKENSGKILQPIGVYTYSGKQYSLPLRYAYDNNEFIDFKSGVEAGVFVMPSAVVEGSSVNIDDDGALLYLSNRTVKSQLARLYLYGEEDSAFKTAHIEDDLIVKNLKQQGALDIDHFVYYQGVRGPITIWEIEYPKGIEFKEEYVETEVPAFLRG